MHLGGSANAEAWVRDQLNGLSLLAPLRGGCPGAVDVIVSIPYISSQSLAGPEVRVFEPRGIGRESRGNLRRCCVSREFLVPGGLLIMEMGAGQARGLQLGSGLAGIQRFVSSKMRRGSERVGGPGKPIDG